MSYPNRIVGEDIVTADDLLANPFNHRIHSHVQQRHMDEVLSRVGWVQRVVVNRNTGHIIDGHMRVVLAMRQNDTIPVVYVDLTEEEEKLILATFDWLGTEAGVDKAKVAEIIADIPDLGIESLEALEIDLGLAEAFDGSDPFDEGGGGAQGEVCGECGREL